MSENALVSLFKTVDNIKSAIELGQTDMVIADSAKLVAQVSAAVAVEGFLRTYSALDGFGRTLSLWRAGQGISGEGIAKQQALAGFVASEMVGALIDQARQLNIGGWIYDLVHPPVSVTDLRTYLANIDWIIGHEQGSDFYQDSSNYAYTGVYDPDGEADIRLGITIVIARNWTLDVRDTCNPLWERVAQGVASPIMIDLKGDGITTTNSWLHSVDFDINGDGVKDRTAWTNGEDAFLAVDSNGNGSIDGVNELFGGLDRGQGFAKLAEFDINGDGEINTQDERFGELLLWQDKNSNGVTDEGELVNAASAGLQSISLSYISQDVYQNGNLLGEVSTAVLQGKKVDVVDVYFRNNSASNSNASNTQEDAGSSELPDAAPIARTPFQSNTAIDTANLLVDQMATFGAKPAGLDINVGHLLAGSMRADRHVELAAF